MNAFIKPAFLARGDYDQSDYDEAIGLRVGKLTDTDAKFDPLEASNFDEALSETLCKLGNGLSATLVAMLRSGEPVNKLLADMSAKYWHDKAVEEAKDDMEDERERALEDAAEDSADNMRYWMTH